MNAHGLVGMPAPGMLHGISVYRELVDLSEENSVLKLSCQYFLKH
jgi:hypothetical protein